MTNKDIRALLEICQKFGVTRVKTADIELELEALPSPSSVLSDATGANLGPLESKPMSDEDILFYSSTGAGV